MIIWDDSNYLMHYGTKGHSGRYPPGSGKNPKTGSRASTAKISKSKKDKPIKKVARENDKLWAERAKQMDKWGRLQQSGKATQEQVDKAYAKYAKFVQDHYKNPYVLTDEERRVFTRVWTKEQAHREYGYVPPEEQGYFRKAMDKVGKGNRTGRGWY